MKTGDKVVCIDDSPSKNTCGCKIQHGLIKGQVYVIAALEDYLTHVGVYLIGINYPYHECRINKRHTPNITRFRLLEEMKKEASLLTTTTV